MDTNIIRLSATRFIRTLHIFLKPFIFLFAKSVEAGGEYQLSALLKYGKGFWRVNSQGYVISNEMNWGAGGREAWRKVWEHSVKECGLQ